MEDDGHLTGLTLRRYLRSVPCLFPFCHQHLINSDAPDSSRVSKREKHVRAVISPHVCVSPRQPRRFSNELPRRRESGPSGPVVSFLLDVAVVPSSLLAQHLSLISLSLSRTQARDHSCLQYSAHPWSVTIEQLGTSSFRWDIRFRVSAGWSGVWNVIENLPVT
jgi:hypothetical protein